MPYSTQYNRVFGSGYSPRHGRQLSQIVKII